jgi:hypothetical protein
MRSTAFVKVASCSAVNRPHTVRVAPRSEGPSAMELRHYGEDLSQSRVGYAVQLTYGVHQSFAAVPFVDATVFI